jgi:GntR family transcriptional regulator
MRMPLPEEVQTLQLLPGTPVGVLLRSCYDRNGRTVEVRRSIIAGDKQVLVYTGTLTT